MKRLLSFLGLKPEKATFKGTGPYWESRYAAGGNSGSGSYGRLACFKAEFLNAFVAEHQIQTILELGCGDGHQLSLARYPQYMGVDISATAVQLCRKQFAEDASKCFEVYRSGALPQAELSLSLDVLYHLIEDEVFSQYLQDLFKSATRYVIIYSTDEDTPQWVDHVKPRRFTPVVAERHPEWKLKQRVPNRYPPVPGHQDPECSAADFFVYERG